MKGFLRRKAAGLCELLLVWLSAWSVSVVGFNAFFLESASMKLPASLLLTGALTGILLGGKGSAAKSAAKVMAYLAVSAATIMTCLGLSTGDAPYADAEGNCFYFAVVAVACPAAAYLLTRTTRRCAAWFAVTAFTCSLVEAFYQRGELVFSIFAVLATLTLCIYRNFQTGAGQAGGDGGATGFCTSLAAACLAIGAGIAVWALVIAPLNPGVIKVTLVTDYRQLPIVQLKGVANQQPTLDYSLSSNQLTGGERYTTDDLYKGVSDIVVSAKSVLDKLAAGGQGQAGQGDGGGSSGTLDRDSTQQDYDARSYTASVAPALIALVVVAVLAALIALAIVLRRRSRARRLARMLAQEPLQQMESIYLFLLRRLARMGFTVPAGMTLTEFAAAQQRRMAVLDAETGVSFARLTDVYVERTCARTEPNKDELAGFVAYYLGFHKAARAYLGRFKYFFKQFRL